jgi:hypothetical protein
MLKEPELMDTSRSQMMSVNTPKPNYFKVLARKHQSLSDFQQSLEKMVQQTLKEIQEVNLFQ